MRIAIDLEGVLAESNVVFPIAVEERYGIKCPKDFQYQFNLMEAAKHALGITMTPADHEGLWSRTWELWDMIPVITSMHPCQPPKCLKEIEKLGHEITILTHSFSEFIEQKKQQWIDANLPGTKVEWVNGAKAKHDYDFDLFVDDGPHNVVALKRHGKRVLLFEQQWNKGVTDAWYERRVYSIHNLHLHLRHVVVE